jgi:hypothetical protein
MVTQAEEAELAEQVWKLAARIWAKVGATRRAGSGSGSIL